MRIPFESVSEEMQLEAVVKYSWLSTGRGLGAFFMAFENRSGRPDRHRHWEIDGIKYVLVQDVFFSNNNIRTSSKRLFSRDGFLKTLNDIDSHATVIIMKFSDSTFMFGGKPVRIAEYHAR